MGLHLYSCLTLEGCLILLGVGTVGGLTVRLLVWVGFVRIGVRVGVRLGLRMGFVFGLVWFFGWVGLGWGGFGLVGLGLFG